MNSEMKAKPAFGVKLRTDDYYRKVDEVIAAAGELATLRIKAENLNSQGLTTPRGFAWDRSNVASYQRQKKES